MKYAASLGMIILAALFAAVPSAAAEDLQGVSYTITPTGVTDEYKINVQISNITAGSLSIEFPGTFEVKDTDIPDGHYGYDDETLIITLTGETEITLDVVCPNLKTGEIIAVWEDLETGTRGGDELSVKESEEEQKKSGEAENQNNENSVYEQRSPGFSAVIAVMSLFTAGFIMYISKREDI